MNPRCPIAAQVNPPPHDRRDEGGFSLIEMAVTMGLGSIVLLIIGILSLNGLTSFVVMGNCTALDDQNRLASDQITRELRQATRILSYGEDADGKTLVLTNSVQGYAVGYTWNAEARTVTCEKTDQPQVTCLKDCDSWDVLFFQNIPQISASLPFLPATNALGQPDLDHARIVGMTWRCSRPVSGSKIDTEGAQSLQILLRNAAPP
jgi:hypothetical protein